MKPKSNKKQISNATLWYYTLSIVVFLFIILGWILTILRAHRSLVKVPMMLSANGSFTEQNWWFIYLITAIASAGFLSLYIFSYSFRKANEILIADGLLILTILIQIFGFAVIYNMTSLAA